MLNLIAEFYDNFFKVFEEKEPEKFFSYKSFSIQGFRGLDNVSVNFTKNDLVLLLGLNESGKTSILRAIECFDYTNDPRDKDLKLFFTSIRNKKEIDCETPAIITAQINIEEKLDSTFFKKALKSAEFGDDVKAEVTAFIERLNDAGSISVSRVIPFSNGNPGKSYYQFKGLAPLSSIKLERLLAQEIVRRSPYIIYFEDFQDAIPSKIYTNKSSEAFNAIWYEIIDGLFYNTDKKYSIKSYLSYFSAKNRRDDDARTVLKKVNKQLQETFTRKWKDLSGVREIEEAEIAFQESKKYFEIKITEKDGTTYSVHERSKGAVWYLAFLMKTEFRRKKLREGSGKPIYLIDEPASNLHSTAQAKMVDDFFTLVEDTTVIYTTHSQYLVSEKNVKNTYVVQRADGVVNCTKWGDYIKGKDAKTSYYQPLYDCLKIVPNNFNIPWDKAIITEGPSDALVIELGIKLLGHARTHAIYPGSTASDLGTLIALNAGWRADFKVLLDGDGEGKKQKERYQTAFGLPEKVFVLLADSRPEIEDLFDSDELINLYEFCFGDRLDKVSKNQCLALFRALDSKCAKDKDRILPILTEATKQRWRTLLDTLFSTSGLGADLDEVAA